MSYFGSALLNINQKTGRVVSITLYLLTFFVLIFCYLPNFFGSFTFLDDDSLINIPQLRLPFSWKLFKVLFTPGYHIDFYPLRDLSYWLDINLFQSFPNPKEVIEFDTDPFRLHNFILFLLSGVGLLQLFIRLRIPILISHILTCLWLVNPFHYEMIAWISARKDIMAMFFMIWSAVFWIQYTRKETHFWGVSSLIFFICSLLSKTTFVFVPFAAAFYYFAKKELKNKTLYLVTAILLSTGWALLQRWHYSHVVDVRFNYPISFQIPASIAALGRMCLGLIFYQFNTVDTYNWGEWLHLNKRFIWPGIAAWGFIIFTLFSAFKNRSLGWYLIFFFATYLPTSGIIFNHVNFYSVRYFEASFLVLIISLAFFVKKRFGRFDMNRLLIVTSVVFLWFSYGLFQESKSWSSNLKLLHKAMNLTPGNPGLLTLYLLRLKEVSFHEKPEGPIHQLIKKVEGNLDKICLPFTQKDPNDIAGVISLCSLYFARGYYPQPAGKILSQNEVKENLLQLEARFIVAAKGFTPEKIKDWQWTRRVLTFDDKSPPPNVKYFPTEQTRREWLAALKKQDPSSKEAERLLNEWNDLGLLFAN